MTRRNWMPLYISDFLTDTTHLTAAETGAYLCLIMHYWMHDKLPDDDRQLATIARTASLKSWLAMRPTIERFFRPGWQHKRIDSELAKMVAISERRRQAASKAGTMSSIIRKKDQQNGKKLSTSRARHVHVASTSGAREVHHSTQDIINTFSEAARARPQTPEENPTKSTTEFAEPPVGLQENARKELRKAKSIGVSGELEELNRRKGWI